MLSGDGGEFSRSKEEAKDENCSEATADDVASADSDSDTDSKFSSLSDAPFGAVDAFSGWWGTRGNAARGELSVSAKTFAFMDGPIVPTRFLGCDELELLFKGRRHRGVLKGDGCLHWDDGDVWTRVVESQFGFRLHAKVCLLRPYWGAAAGECGTVVGFTRSFVEVTCVARVVRCSGCDLRLCEPEAAREKEAEAPEQQGARKDDRCRHLDDGDVCALGAHTFVESRFGFRLHSKVRLLRGYLGAAAGEFGTVVGFTRAFVEVKCAARIVRCPGCDLRLCEPEAAREKEEADAPKQKNALKDDGCRHLDDGDVCALGAHTFVEP